MNTRKFKLAVILSLFGLLVLNTIKSTPSSLVHAQVLPQVTATPVLPVFIYPTNGQSLDYEGSYLFKVQPIISAQGFLWGFFQNGVMVWENLRDEGRLSTNEYAITVGSLAHSKFSLGDVEVWVRASINGQWTDATAITIHLQPGPTSTPTSTATPTRTNTPTAIPTITSTPVPGSTALPLRVPVLVLAYYPRNPSNPDYLDPTETGENNRKITDMQTNIENMILEGQSIINDATRYHGYKDANAPMYLQYFTYQKFEFFTPIPRGYFLGGTAYRPNHGQILRDLNICNYVDTNGVKEVWLYGYHSAFIVPDESKMSSKYGDVSNAVPKDEYVDSQYRLPRCNNSYVLYDFNYFRGTDTNVHNRMHQIENVIFFAENMGYPVNTSNVQGSVFWDDFAVWGDRALLSGYKASCGNTHSPPNTTNGYDYTSTQYRENNCETWNPDDSKTTYVNRNCTQWGCTELGFHKWFMQNMPGYNNGIVYAGRQMRNWWEAMYDFNGFIDAGWGLYKEIPLPTSPVFEYPVDGQTLDYEGSYLLKVQPMANAQGYLWGFFQNGVMVWENWRDENSLSSNEYSIWEGGLAHSKFVVGDVQIWVRAKINEQWTDATVITIHLRPRARLLVNYATGQPGSYFNFTGTNFPVNGVTTLIVNGRVVTNTLASDSSGNLSFQFKTEQADIGYYFVTASANPTTAFSGISGNILQATNECGTCNNASTRLALDTSAPLRLQEGVFTLINLPKGIAFTNLLYLPVVAR